jgi:hypothetical protein
MLVVAGVVLGRDSCGWRSGADHLVEVGQFEARGLDPVVHSNPNLFPARIIALLRRQGGDGGEDYAEPGRVRPADELLVGVDLLTGRWQFAERREFPGADVVARVGEYDVGDVGRSEYVIVEPGQPRSSSGCVPGRGVEPEPVSRNAAVEDSDAGLGGKQGDGELRPAHGGDGRAQAHDYCSGQRSSDIDRAPEWASRRKGPGGPVGASPVPVSAAGNSRDSAKSPGVVAR